jgi:hypothetical protein
LVALTYLAVSNLPKASENPGAPESKKSIAPAAKKEKKAAKQYSPCAEIANRLQRLVREKSGKPEEWRLPDSCYEVVPPNVLKQPEAYPAVRFAIATVPNPISTHLALLFDRIVETIQQAAQDETYSYDDSWFPWETTTKEFPLLGDQQAADELREIQEAQPGVMVFRKGVVNETDGGAPYESGLIVLVVGEKPTGGINDNQFVNALAWIEQLGGLSGKQPLNILGPAFSGSLPSLQRALVQDLAAGQPTAFNGKILVTSGTVSSGIDYQWFATWISSNQKGTFRAAMENDSLMTDRFCQYLIDRGYPPKKIAFLSEDETAFGGVYLPTEPQKTQTSFLDQQPVSPCSAAFRLYYPRDIATLRSAYQQQSILSPAKPQSNAAPATTLRGDLTEPSSSDHDTVRSYGGQLTPLEQESILLDIANRLNDKQIQFIILRSTSSLDQIFLSQFLRRFYPEGRVVIDGADLLFNRGAEGKSLRGVMLLSTYPLLPVEQDWTASLVAHRTRSYRAFGEDNAEGVYIAARELFHNQDSSVPLHDYGAPEWAIGIEKTYDEHDENTRPATWLTVIGRRQLWPLAVLNSNTLPTLKNSPAKAMPEPSSGRDLGPPFKDVQPEPLSVPVSMWLFVIACVAWGAIHAYFCWYGSIVGSPRARAYFAPLPRRQHAPLIALGSLFPAMVAVVLATESGLFSQLVGMHLYERSTVIWLTILVILILFLSLFACLGSYRLPVARPPASPAIHMTAWRRLIGGTALLWLVVFALGHISLVNGLTQANSVPAYLRAVNLFSGVSSLLPQLLLIAGAYLWFWCTLRGLAHFGDDRPCLPQKRDLPKLDDGTPMMPMFSNEKAGCPIEDAARPLSGPYLMWFGVALVASGLVSGIALQGPWVRTLGERTFGGVIFFSVIVCISVIIADGIEMWRAWSELRKLLAYLDRLPLRRTLRALKGLAWGSIWKLSGNVLDERYRVISFQLESLRHLMNTATEWSPDFDEANDRIEVLRQVRECQARAAVFARWYVRLPEKIIDLTYLRDFQKELAPTAAVLMNHVLLPAWRKEKESLIFDRSKPEGKPDEDGGPQTAISTTKLEPHVQAAEEFFVLPYVAFIQNVLGRLRCLALGVLWLFVSATLAVSSYPFDPLNVVGGIFLTVFLIVGGLIILVYAQMSRDATLSHITNTRPGELGMEFWTRLVTFGVGPLIGLLTTLFPSLTDFLFSWLEPSVQALK